MLRILYNALPEHAQYRRRQYIRAHFEFKRKFNSEMT